MIPISILKHSTNSRIEIIQFFYFQKNCTIEIDAFYIIQVVGYFKFRDYLANNINPLMTKTKISINDFYLLQFFFERWAS